LDDFLTNKRRLANEYAAYFDSQEIQFREELKGTKASYWLMSVELPNKEARDCFLEETNNSGVMTRPIWQLMFKLPMFEKCFRDDQKNALYLEDRIVNIPSSVRV